MFEHLRFDAQIAGVDYREQRLPCTDLLAGRDLDGVYGAVHGAPNRGAILFVPGTLEAQPRTHQAGLVHECLALLGRGAATGHHRLGHKALQKALFGFVRAGLGVAHREVKRIPIQTGEHLPLGDRLARSHHQLRHRARHFGAQLHCRIRADLPRGRYAQHQVAIARLLGHHRQGQGRATGFLGRFLRTGGGGGIGRRSRIALVASDEHERGEYRRHSPQAERGSSNGPRARRSTHWGRVERNQHARNAAPGDSTPLVSS